MTGNVIVCGEFEGEALAQLLARYGLQLSWLAFDTPIPGSFWGDSEAGLVGDRLYIRSDTPLHSALHEACHYICMDSERRAGLHTNAGGDDLEECAVCYLQILLADYLPQYDRDRMLAEMDHWGYSFRLGSARAWFEQDADDARDYLRQHGLIDENEQPSWQLRSVP